MPRRGAYLGLMAVIAIAAAAPRPAAAIGKIEAGERSLELTGAMRLTGAYLLHTDAWSSAEDDGIVAGVGRLIAELQLEERLSGELNLFVELSRAPQLMIGGALATASSYASPYRYRGLAWDFWDSGSVTGALGLDRAALKLRLSRVEITIGRMPINYSVTSIFTPNDVFAPFSAAAINKVYKPGVDALRASFAPGALSTIEVAGVVGWDAGGDLDWGRSALVARASTVLWGVEGALLGGKLAERWFVGGSLQGEIGAFELRAEGHAGFPDRDGDGRLDRSEGIDRAPYARVAASLQRRFLWRNLTLGAEVMYVSDGARRPELYIERLATLMPDDVPYFNRLYVGLSAGGEIIPILRLTALVLWNALDYSGLGMLALAYNIADEADFVGGALVPWGERSEPASEYGLMPIVLFLETRFYF